MNSPIKGLLFHTDRNVERVTITGLDTMQDLVGGLIEPIDMFDGSTLYVNEEGLYIYPDRPNLIATMIAAEGSNYAFLFNPIFGPAFIVGPLDKEGDHTDLPDRTLQWVRKILREHGVEILQ